MNKNMGFGAQNTPGPCPSKMLVGLHLNETKFHLPLSVLNTIYIYIIKEIFALTGRMPQTKRRNFRSFR